MDEELRSLTNTGPHVTLAVLCRGVMKQFDGSFDLTGVVGHTIAVAPDADGATRQSLPGLVLLALDSGLFRGSCTLTVRLFYPDNTLVKSISRLAEFSDDSPELVTQFPMGIPVRGAGTYSIEVLRDGERLARISWKVVARVGGTDAPLA